MNYHLSLLSNITHEVDCIIATVPWTRTSIPLMAPAVLKPIVEASNLSCLAIDLNNNIIQLVDSSPYTDELIKFFFNEEYDNYEMVGIVSKLFETIVNDMLALNPKIICLSLFSYISQNSAKWLAYLIKEANPNIIIILGGAGCLDTFVGESKFIKFMIDSNFADYHIRGDGEQALYELLTGNDKFNGINDKDWKQLSREEVSQLPFPNYNDYDFSSYSLKTLPLLGSRGCVRKCQYCDYIENWKKFTWRNADDIFNEMQVQHKKYNIRRFKFQDSLTNGNVIEFTKLIELIANYNTTHPNESYSWSGYYIFRNVNKNTDREWQMLKQSNPDVLTVGIENLNEDIRFMIGKKFTNEAIDYHLEQAYNLKIPLVFLNIVGYVNETQEHIKFIKEWLASHTKYKDLVKLGWGAGLGIFPHTYLDRHKEDLGILMYGDEPFKWTSNNINSTPIIRANWVKELTHYSKELGYTVSNFDDNHFLIEVLLHETK